MKKIMKKTISFIQIIILLLAIAMPCLVVITNEAVAATPETIRINSGGSSLFSYETNLSKKLKITTRGTIDCYSSNSYNHIYLDYGLPIYSTPTDTGGNLHYTEIYSGVINTDDDAGEPLGKVDGNRSIDLDEYDGDVFTIITKKSISSLIGFGAKEKEIGRAFIHIRYNSILLGSNNAGINKKNTTCNNAIIVDDTLYVSPGASIELTTSWNENRGSTQADSWYEIESGDAGINVKDNKLNISENVKLGAKGKIIWENESGSTCSINVVTSNFADEIITVNGLSNVDISSYSSRFCYYGDFIYTQRTLYVARGETAKIKVTQGNKFESKNAIASTLMVRDETECLKGIPSKTYKVKAGVGYYEVSFTAKTTGVISLTYYDYEGKEYTTFCYIVPVNSGTGNTVDDENTPEYKQEENDNNTYNSNETSIDDGKDNSSTPEKQKPTINITAGEESNGTVKIDVTTKDATAVKYLIKERTTGNYISPVTNNSKYNNYSSTEGWKEVETPNKFSVTVSAYALGSGNYDITVLAKNTNNDIISYSACKDIFVNAVPITGIYEITNKRKDTRRVYTVSSQSADRDKIESYYYVIRKELGTFDIPEEKEIIENGTKFTGGADITIDIESSDSQYINKGAGYYDIIVYAKDQYGKSSISSLTSIPISNPPEVNYEILEEVEGSIYTKNTNSKHTVNVQVSDKDINNKLSVWYYISDEENLENSTIEQFYKNGKDIKWKSISGNSGNFDIEVTSEAGKNSEKYIYLMVQDNYGKTTLKRTGCIKVDGTELILEGISIEPNTNPISVISELENNNENKISIGEKISVSCVFNHKISEKMSTNYPNLKLKFGDTERTQDLVEVEGNTVTYIYIVSKYDSEGAVSIIGFEYLQNSFEDAYVNPNKYNIQIGDDEKNVVSVANLVIDTTIPTVETIEIAYTTDENSKIIYDSINDKKYISDIKDVQCKLTYSENVVGCPVQISFKKGNNYVFWAKADKPETETARRTDTYSLIDNKIKSYSGNYAVMMFAVNLDLTDEAGNKVDTKNYNVIYTLNGELINNEQIVLDDSTSTGKIAVNEEIINNNSYMCGTGLEVECFTEYKNGNTQDFQDASGIKSIGLMITKEGNAVIVKDKNGNAIEESGQEESEYYYELTEGQLPISFEVTDEGEYTVVTSKTDNLDNTSTKTVNLEVTSYAQISEESGIDTSSIAGDIESKGGMYNLYDIISTEDNKNGAKYNLFIKLDSSLSNSDVNIHIYDSLLNEINTLEYVGQEENDGILYEKYQFKIVNSFEYTVKVVDKDNTQILHEQKIKLKNVFIPGDTNYDGKLTSADCIRMLKQLVGILNDPEIYYPGNVDNDEKGLTISDVILLNRFLTEDSTLELTSNGYIKSK